MTKLIFKLTLVIYGNNNMGRTEIKLYLPSIRAAIKGVMLLSNHFVY